MTILKQAVSAVGGPQRAAQICGVSVRAVYKWLSRGSLPRTEYTGETAYAEALAKASESTEFPFSAVWLREESRPEAA